ncbi:hypothetical protein MJO28_016002 [Puccinia striiformis f. sp. tritici]|uniref:Uncharacterized protein n=2 Tax=Puccinia striiformis f. sp. tritici TaxID=168172 RepID=A0A0L0VCU0_9BASI|nr:hypothetical protein MJO28_016002 [Puccinia striiformis f. sp. tritici]KAI9617289.1 hypothetical protein H4Q26_013158 [Puccinia striiformis f. sp. tritici PST-130]KNE97103.1 hypothetical protein PSTG_09677 [Puccinia striiformis f. sp. tritici PST-78]
MNLLSSLGLPFLVFQVIMGLDLTSKNLNKVKSRSIHSSREALDWSIRGGGSTGDPAPPEPKLPNPCC